MSNTIIGGWSKWKPVDAKESELAQKVFQEFVNNNSINSKSILPLLEKHQVVSGMNYKFIVEEFNSMHSAGLHKLEFYQDAQGEIHDVSYHTFK